jgi:hypothetical protein
MGWANAQAEKARAERGLVTPNLNNASFEEQMQGMSVSDEEPALSERVFMELLAASDELSQVRQSN